MKVWGWLAALVLVMALAGCGDGRLLSRREVAERLERKYGEAFAITPSEGVARQYTAVSRERPEREFFVFDIVTGESGGVFGFVNGLRDTYALDVFFEAFRQYAEEAGVEYGVNYDRTPYRVSEEYYSGIEIVIELVGPDALGTVCQVLADACGDTLEAIPGAAGKSVEVRVLLRYREEAWEEGAYCAFRVSLFSAMNFDYEVEMERFVSAEALEESVLAEVRRWLGKEGDS